MMNRCYKIGTVAVALTGILAFSHLVEADPLQTPEPKKDPDPPISDPPDRTYRTSLARSQQLIPLPKGQGACAFSDRLSNYGISEIGFVRESPHYTNAVFKMEKLLREDGYLKEVDHILVRRQNGGNASAWYNIYPPRLKTISIIGVNPLWFRGVAEETNDPKWTIYSAMAHELGHLAMKHRASTRKGELEADWIAGRLMCQLGRSLEDAKRTHSIFPFAGSPTHPGRKQRLAAVRSGWNSCTPPESEREQTAETCNTAWRITFGDNLKLLRRFKITNKCSVSIWLTDIYVINSSGRSAGRVHLQEPIEVTPNHLRWVNLDDLGVRDYFYYDRPELSWHP